MKKYDLIIFDFDGTLADSTNWFRSILNQIALQHGFKQMDEAEMEKLRSYSSRMILKHLEIPFWKIPFIARTIKKQFSLNSHQIKLYEGVDSLLENLEKAGLKLAIVSSNSEENVRKILGEKNSRLITHYSCGVALFGKARIFKSIIKSFGVDRKRTLAIGDEGRDIEAGREAGVITAAVCWGYATSEFLASQKPDHLFLSIDDIEKSII